MKIQSSIIRDTLELINPETGETEKALPFVVNVSQISSGLLKIRKDMQEMDQTDLEKVGQVMVELFTLVFGEANTAELLDYYANDYQAMMLDLTPVLTERIYPAVNRVHQKTLELQKKVGRRG